MLAILGLLPTLPSAVKLSWADRSDRLFLTAHVAGLEKPAVWLQPDGQLTVNGSVEADAPGLNVTLFGEIVPEQSTWRVRGSAHHKQRVEMMLVKAERGRWRELLRAGGEQPFVGQVVTDLDKFLDPDEELDEEEKAAGLRGVPVVGDRQMEKAVDDYFKVQREKQRESGKGADLQSIMDQAEKEQKRTGEEFNAIVQRLYREASAKLQFQREREAEEEAWASAGAGPRERRAKRGKRRTDARRPKTEL